MSRRGLYYFILHAHARRGRDGAYIGCWIDYPSEEGALAVARYYVRQQGWRIRSVQQRTWFASVAHAHRSSRRYYKEAKRDGASFVFHRYRRGTPGAVSHGLPEA